MRGGPRLASESRRHEVALDHWRMIEKCRSPTSQKLADNTARFSSRTGLKGSTGRGQEGALAGPDLTRRSPPNASPGAGVLWLGRRWHREHASAIQSPCATTGSGALMGFKGEAPPRSNTINSFSQLGVTHDPV